MIAFSPLDDVATKIKIPMQHFQNSLLVQVVASTHHQQ